MSPSTGNKATEDVARSQAAERITIALIPKAGGDLQRLQARTGLSKTDLANRAIQLYEFIEEQRSEGREVLIRDKSAGEIQVVRLL